MPARPVERRSLFHGLWLQSVRVAVEGGAAIGTLVGLGMLGPLGAIFGCTAGIFCGLIFGGVYGLAVGVVGARVLNPYPGPRRTVRIGRGLALSGGLVFGACPSLLGWGDLPLPVLLPPLLGWLLGPQLVIWYLRANGE